jgi:hypothetical protein
VSRERRAADWTRDLAAARETERLVAGALLADPRVQDLRDDTSAFDRLDFSFSYRGMPVSLDVKEKLQRYSPAIRDLWPEVQERDLFIIDETVYRRIVWQGGGGYLALHDDPGRRWVILGPWELTLARHIRYGRWGQRHDTRFLKGKLLFNLSCARRSTELFTVEDVLRLVDEARSWRDRVEPYPLIGSAVRQLGI